MGKRKRRSPVAADLFVEAWQQSSTHREVAKALGMKESTVKARARRLRKVGVRLPPYKGTRRPLDVDALNALIEETNG